MSAKLIRSTYNITNAQQGGVLTIGNFDGVHLGHQQLLTRVKEIAQGYHIPSVVVTFEPHPFEFFTREKVTIPRITRLREKFCILSDYGVQNVLILPFNQKLADIPADHFVEHILYKSLRPRHLIIGDDFRFGSKRQGDFNLLKEKGSQLGFSVESIATVKVDGERVSSTRVRQMLAEGNLTLVERLLGRPYAMLGRIRHGAQRGRQWGFPTANIYLHRRLTPVRGVYTVYVHGVADHPWPAVANIGIRPTVDGTRSLLEVHLLDFNQEIYGHYVKVEFCKKLRDEERFQTIDLLKEQIAKDVLLARDYFTKQIK